MKCKDCNACEKGFFKSQPDKYVCIGTKEPFIIDNIEDPCTEYPEKNKGVVQMISEKEILDALNLLKNVCKENNGRCDKCMLRNGEDYCGVMTNSNGDYYNKLTDWELKDYENPRLILS